MRRHRVDLRDGSVDRDAASVNPNLTRSVDELSSAGARGLIADEEHGVLLIG
jgi:hypothetical protein